MQIPIIFYCKRKGLHVSSMQTTINTQPAQIQPDLLALPTIILNKLSLCIHN